MQLGQSTLQEATEAMNTISMPGVSASQPPGASPSPQAPLALPAPPPLAATPYLQIVGMVTAEVLADDEEYSEVSFVMLEWKLSGCSKSLNGSCELNAPM